MPKFEIEYQESQEEHIGHLTVEAVSVREVNSSMVEALTFDGSGVLIHIDGTINRIQKIE